ncbi:MAG: toxin-antitoxin system YwqK family antitoxin [Phaeodactylibacter sp.]|nr:toxin-antitoxin system YwqK family antitoxin [Phaeodactylibacter sp.]
MMRIPYLTVCIAALLTVLSSCGNAGGGGGAAAAEQFDSSGYATEEIPGTPYVRATKRNVENNLREEGLLRDGVKEGTWIVYHSGGEFPEKIISYASGLYNGPYMEFNERGQLSLRASYKNNILDGPWGKYRFGRPEAEANYKNGQFDGTYKEYDSQSGKIIKEINYKDGKQHGKLRFYNDKGEVTLEYEYRDGEKVSGGIVEGE